MPLPHAVGRLQGEMLRKVLSRASGGGEHSYGVAGHPWGGGSWAQQGSPQGLWEVMPGPQREKTPLDLWMRERWRAVSSGLQDQEAGMKIHPEPGRG